jgi:hypothetical protein
MDIVIRIDTKPENIKRPEKQLHTRFMYLNIKKANLHKKILILIFLTINLIV